MDKIPFYIATVLIILLSITFPFCVKAIDKIEKNEQKPTYSAIIEVWQLDMLEAGKGSRKSFLEKYSAEFEKNNNVLINVSVETKKSAEYKMSKGIYPDVLSYSQGLTLPFENLIALSGEKSFGGVYNKKNYALPWAYGGYVIICRKGENFKGNLYVSQNAYTQPLISYYLSEFRFNNLNLYSPTEAYTSFMADAKGVLIGTQRDLFRLSKRNIDVDVKILSSFSDIVLYASAIENNNGKSNIAKKYVEFLSKASQSDLDSIGMLSVNDSTKSQNTELEVFNGFYPSSTLSVFTKDIDLKGLQTFLSDFNKSDEEKLNRIKNVVQ